MYKHSLFGFTPFVLALTLSVFFAFPAHASTYTFSSNLFLGSSGVQVQELQQVLNTDPNTRVALSGPGSPGEETEYFGLLTQAAVERFQQKYMSQVLVPAGLSAANGFVGYYTRLMLNALSNGTVTTPTPVTSTLCGPGALYNSLTGQPCSANTQTTPVSTITPSPSGTTIPGVAEIVDSQGNIWTESNAYIYRNSVAVSYSSTFSLLLSYNNTIYQEDSSCQWWYWTGSVWVSTGNPEPGAVSSCSSTPTQLGTVNGSCGSSSGISMSSAPTDNFCSTGSASSIEGSGPWYWNCSGTSGGSTALCSANTATTVVSGSCGASNNLSLASAPTTNLCATGSASAVNGSGPWSWACSGSNGGSAASCSASLSTSNTSNSNPTLHCLSLWHYHSLSLQDYRQSGECVDGGE
jgi:peptidoglycan hydrolase-like protein with peptidoglycan-binding domain